MQEVKDKKLLRKQRRQEETRHAIFAAAEEVFGQKGYYKAAMEEIAEEAGFATGTLYNFFRSKEDLYEKVIEQVVADFMEDFEEQVLPVENPLESIRALVRLRLEYSQTHKAFLKVFWETSPVGRVDIGRGLPQSCARMAEEIDDKIIGIFRQGIDAGCFAPLDPMYMMLALEGVINSFVAYWFYGEKEISFDEQMRLIDETFLSRISVPPGSMTAEPRQE